MSQPIKSSDDSLPAIERSLAAEIKIYYDLVVPFEREAKERPRPTLIVLHGYGGNKRQMMREAQLLSPPNFVLVSLQGVHQHLKEPRNEGGPLRYGFGWLTNFHPEESIELHHNALLDLIDSLVDEGITGREQVFLLGFSQSCAVNYRFAFTHTGRVCGVIGICGGLPGDWETSGLYKQSDTGVLHLCGARDEFYQPARVGDYASRLRTRARDVEVKSYDAGHEIAPAMRDDVRAWLESHVNS